MDEAVGQPKQRRGVQFEDQHGRRWHATIERSTGHSVGAMQPMFKTPLTIPAKYVKHDKDDDHKIEIQYQAWIRDVEMGNRNWEAALRKEAKRLGVAGTIEGLISNPPQELLDEIGPRPKVVNTEVIMAAEAGNMWINHGEGDMPEQAKQYFPNWGEEVETHNTSEGVAVSDPWAVPPAKEKSGFQKILTGTD